MIKPFLRWSGGKQNLISELLKHTPEDNLIGKYYEPFLGAGSLFFANGFDNAFISDINPQLINSYEEIRTDYKRIYRLLQLYQSKFTKDESFYYAIRDKFNDNINVTDYKQAARFIFLIHTNYNGIYRVNLDGKYNVPIGKRVPSIPTLEHLKIVGLKLKGKTIRNLDYKKILKLVKKNDFIYLDPPYPPINWDNHLRQYTIDKFTKTNQEELAAFSNKLNDLGCFVMISNSDVPFIKKLYKNWNIVKIQTTRSISGRIERKKINELIIKNY